MIVVIELFSLFSYLKGLAILLLRPFFRAKVSPDRLQVLTRGPSTAEARGWGRDQHKGVWVMGAHKLHVRSEGGRTHDAAQKLQSS